MTDKNNGFKTTLHNALHFIPKVKIKNLVWQGIYSVQIDYILNGNYMFKVNDRNTRIRCEIYSNSVFSPKARNYGPEKLRGVVLVSLTYFPSCSSVSIVKFEQVNATGMPKYYVT